MDTDLDHPLARQQATYNRSTREHWAHFAAHREKIHQLVVGDGSLGTGGRLCVLGAGNCNDLDLPELARVFSHLELVDLDPAAVTSAVERQGVHQLSHVKVRAPVDLSAVADQMSTWPKRTVSAREVGQCVAKIRQAPSPDLGGTFDVVLSPCVLSQIVGYADDTLGKSHGSLRAVRTALRDRHLRIMADLLSPGGWGVLVTDVASTRVIEDLHRKPLERLPDLMQSLVGRAKAYSGLAPAEVEQAVRGDPLLAGRLQQMTTMSPWVWTLGPLKSFLVYAMRFRRSSGTLLLG